MLNSSTAKHYRLFMQESMGQRHEPRYSGSGFDRSFGGWSHVLSWRRKGQREGIDERILGSGDFVQQVINEAEDKSLRQMEFKRTGLTLNKTIEQECTRGQISRRELENRSHQPKVSQTRAEIACRAIEEIWQSAAEI